MTLSIAYFMACLISATLATGAATYITRAAAVPMISSRQSATLKAGAILASAAVGALALRVTLP